MVKLNKIILFGVVVFTAACDFKLDEVDELRIGQSQEEVLQRLSRQGVQDVVPILEDSIVVKQNQIDELRKLYKSSGLCLSDYSGVFIKLNFDRNNKLVELYTSPMMKSESFGIQVDQSKEEVISLLKKVLEDNSKVTIESCIFDHHWVRLKEIDKEDLVYLQRYSLWRYHKSDSYSYITLKFEEEKLTEIKYHWRPYEEA